jgi:hypothetical protein
MCSNKPGNHAASQPSGICRTTVSFGPLIMQQLPACKLAAIAAMSAAPWYSA